MGVGHPAANDLPKQKHINQTDQWGKRKDKNNPHRARAFPTVKSKFKTSLITQVKTQPGPFAFAGPNGNHKEWSVGSVSGSRG